MISIWIGMTLLLCEISWPLTITCRTAWENACPTDKFLRVLASIFYAFLPSFLPGKENENLLMSAYCRCLCVFIYPVWTLEPVDRCSKYLVWKFCYWRSRRRLSLDVTQLVTKSWRNQEIVRRKGRYCHVYDYWGAKVLYRIRSRKSILPLLS
jgi:hypothetical protein